MLRGRLTNKQEECSLLRGVLYKEFHCTYTCMLYTCLVCLFDSLKDKLQNHLVDDFVEALELLNSPELVCKVCRQTLCQLLLVCV